VKSVTSFVLAAAFLAVIGVLLLVAGRIDHDMATAQEQVITRHYDAPVAVFDRVEQYLEYARHVPGIGEGPLNEVRARKAALGYWQNQFGTLMPDQTDPVGAVAADNVDLQLIVAHSVYRAGQQRAKDRQSTLQVLDAAIEGYLTVLKNSARNDTAAFNYEYLVRLRGEVEKGRRKPDLPAPTLDRALGAEGVIPRPAHTGDFKVLVPLDSPERDKSGTAGKAPPIKRKG
jgi:hypothetical protein